MVAVLRRLAEPSSWAGISAVLATLGVNVPSQLWQAIVFAASGLCGVAAFFIPEKGANT